jgi:DNA-binding NtrC family response regulator
MRAQWGWREKDVMEPVTVIIVDREPLYRWFIAESLDLDGTPVIEFGRVADAAQCPALSNRKTVLLIDGQTLRDEGPAPLAALCRQRPDLHYLVLDPAGPGPTRAAAPTLRSVAKPVDCDTVRQLIRAVE